MTGLLRTIAIAGLTFSVWLALSGCSSSPQPLPAELGDVHQTDEGVFFGSIADYLRAAKTYERLGDYDHAKANFEKARELAPQNLGVLMAVGDFYDRIGNNNAATEAYSQVYSIDPNTPGVVEGLARNVCD